MYSSIRRIISLAGLLALGGAAVYAQLPARAYTLQPGSRVWFDGTSNVRAFSCAATQLDAAVMGEAVAAGQNPERLITTATLAIPVAGLDCRNGRMNGHMRNALKANANPRITWRMSSYRVAGDSVIIAGHLTIAGRENEIELRGAGSAPDGVIRLSGVRSLKMTDYGVKPPTLMLGTLRVHDEVRVRFDLALAQ